MSARPSPASSPPRPRPIIFLDLDGVLNTTKHHTQIHLEPPFLTRLHRIVETTDAWIVLTTFWRHFHYYIAYVLHRHGIDVARHLLPLPMGATGGRQCTKTFVRFHRRKQTEDGHCDAQEDVGEEEGGGMMGRSADDEGEYASRAEEIAAWLRAYGARYMGTDANSNNDTQEANPHGSNEEDDKAEQTGEYAFHREEWRYVILDDRPTAAIPGTPLFERFVHTETERGLTEEDAQRAIELLRCGP